jgi:hypothetical protein
MGKVLSTGRLSTGVIDGPDDVDCPQILKSEGFDYRRGYARTEYGRQKLTSSEIVASTQPKNVLRWVRADGTTRFYCMINGRLYESTTNTFATATLRSEIHPGDTGCRISIGGAAVSSVSASRSGNTVTLTNGWCLRTLSTSLDKFYYDADGIANAATIASVDSETQITLSAYGGSATSGAFTIVRTLGTGEAHLIVAGDELMVFDGTNKPQTYMDRGDGTFEFRQVGLPVPGTPTVCTLAAGGALSAGDYWWAYAYEDEAGNVGNPLYSNKCTAAADDKCTMTIVSGPAWATKIRVWRTKVGGSQFFSTYTDYGSANPLKLATAAKDNGHINRYVKFATTGNYYRITDNDGNTLTVSGDASSATGGETGTDKITIEGGYDIEQVVSSGFVDLMADTSLDVDYEAPTDNDEPVAKLTKPVLLEGGGRLMAYEEDTQTLNWFSGRNDGSKIEAGASTGGLGEFHYWHTSHYAGRQDGDEIVANLRLGDGAFALKQSSVWELVKLADDPRNWQFAPAALAQNIGCLAAHSVAVKEGVAYWLGADGQEVDVIRFDGQVGYGMLRRVDPRTKTSRNRVFLDAIVSHSVATGAIYQGRYWLSFPGTSGATTNNRTLRFDLRTQALDIQPWGCGVFAPPYHDGSGNFILLCCAPTAAGDIYRPLGTQADGGSNIARELILKAFTFGVDFEGNWQYIRLRMINGETITAPTLSYSVDGLAFDDSNKTWETTVSGETWQTTTGQYPVTRVIETGEQSDMIHVKLTSTDAKDWGVLEVEVEGEPIEKRTTQT